MTTIQIRINFLFCVFARESNFLILLDRIVSHISQDIRIVLERFIWIASHDSCIRRELQLKLRRRMMCAALFGISLLAQCLKNFLQDIIQLLTVKFILEFIPEVSVYDIARSTGVSSLCFKMEIRAETCVDPCFKRRLPIHTLEDGLRAELGLQITELHQDKRIIDNEFVCILIRAFFGAPIKER